VPIVRLKLAVNVAICEVGPRDGLQNESTVLEPAARAELVNRLGATGLPRIEAVSFVNPERVPQMAGAEQVIEAIERREGVAYAGLVLNDKGYARFAKTELDRVHFTLGATETFNRRNANASIEESVGALARIQTDRPVSVSISVAFGCPFEGEVEPGAVLSLAEKVLEAGADEVVFADTIGVAVPRQIRDVLGRVRLLGTAVGAHLHNTRNTGYANALAALESGATVLDASIGGIGGCPFAPRATGNIATEDLVYVLHGEGIDTGIDLEALISVAEWLEGVLERPLEGHVYRAGAFASLAG
jgi:isopropylmalate/homocitrate/citramalate synthase